MGFQTLKTRWNGALVAPFFLFASLNASAAAKHVEASKAQLETYQDLIAKAQNLTLQQDRLQTSQILIRGLQRETKGSAAYRELERALDDLTSVFYAEKTQSLFAAAEATGETHPREAIDQLQEALKSEERHPVILKALARFYLQIEDCEKADARNKQAAEINPYSLEVKLLALQVLECKKDFETLETKLDSADDDVKTNAVGKGLQAQLLMREAKAAIKAAGDEDAESLKEVKKARSFLQAWEAQSSEYPAVFYWKYQLSKLLDAPDRNAAGKYVQLCQNLTPRKRKSFSLDVDLCKGKEEVDEFLREPVATPAPLGRTRTEGGPSKPSTKKAGSKVGPEAGPEGK